MPIPGGGGDLAAWSPTFDQVASYVPWLTVSRTVPGSQEYLNTFTENTSPSDTVALSHIADAVTLISGRITTMPADLYELASVVAARMAAATLAAAYARTDEDRNRALALTTTANTYLDSLLAAVDNEGASTLSPVPVLHAPDPVPWGDTYL